MSGVVSRGCVMTLTICRVRNIQAHFPRRSRSETESEVLPIALHAPNGIASRERTCGQGTDFGKMRPGHAEHITQVMRGINGSTLNERALESYVCARDGFSAESPIVARSPVPGDP